MLIALYIDNHKQLSNNPLFLNEMDKRKKNGLIYIIHIFGFLDEYFRYDCGIPTFMHTLIT